MTDSNSRHSDLPVDAMFLDRWSPRAFTGEPISEEQLMTVLEAGRWAASSYNAQPWRFIWARRDTAHWNRLFDLLVPGNQAWAKDAAALVVIVSNPLTLPPGDDKPVPSHTHSFDAGTASGYVALQANRMGLYVHGMVGFDLDRAFTELDVPQGYRVEAAFAIGHKGDPATLPERLRAREAPNDRKPLSELAFEGGFPSEG